ncbi:hypothetical protein Csa_007643, partial [Cucumis sativus]
ENKLRTGVDIEHIKLVDNETQFEAYPWGRIRVGDSNLCMLNWIVDCHPEWKELAEK